MWREWNMRWIALFELEEFKYLSAKVDTHVIWLKAHASTLPACSKTDKITLSNTTR